jgi:acyl-CoA thioesterase
LDGALYGGTAIAASLAAIEWATGRDVVWATTQFVSSAPQGSTVECVVEPLAEGRRTVQARLTATVDGAVMFAAVGAAGILKPDGLSGQPESMPDIGGPGESDPAMTAAFDADFGWHRAVEMRTAPGGEPSRTYFWSRFRDGQPVTPARLAFVADMVPLSVARACGAIGAGTSLDNTFRVGPAADTEWVLLDLRPHFALGGYGHGDVHLWGEDGTLLATGSQTASMLIFDSDPLSGGTLQRS